MTYTQFRHGGKTVAALYAMSDETKASGQPPAWLSYLAVESVDDIAKSAASLGANVMAEPMDVMEVGRMSIVQDPVGAVVGLWEAKLHIGAEKVNEVGSMAWNELLTRDTSGAEKFYTELFGWNTRVDPIGDGTGSYTTFRRGDAAVGGMFEMNENIPAQVPPHWNLYFEVPNCDATVARAQELGGQALMGVHEMEGVGRFATLQDPQGATFSVITSATQTQS
jgi:predicted enzyme related to lactoylglutathione lyase